MPAAIRICVLVGLALIAALRFWPRNAPPSPPPPIPPGATFFWHVTDWHLNLFHDRHGDVRDMCRSATADASRWPGAFGHFNCDPSRQFAEAAVAQMAADAADGDTRSLDGSFFSSPSKFWKILIIFRTFNFGKC